VIILTLSSTNYIMNVIRILIMLIKLLLLILQLIIGHREMIVILCLI